MTNLIQKLFLSEQKLSILNAIEMGDIKYEQKNWAEPGRRDINRMFNRSQTMYTIKHNGIKVEISREYMEQVESEAMRGNNQTPPTVYMVRIYKKDEKAPCFQDFNSSFATKMFGKVSKAYATQSKESTKLNTYKKSNVR